MRRILAGALLSLCLLAPARAAEGPTCDAAAIDPASLRLTTRAVAFAVTQPRHSWWDSFDLGKYADDLADLNSAVTHVAERALEIDPRNLMGHSILARQYLVLEEPEPAEAAWGAVMAAGGSWVLWFKLTRRPVTLVSDRSGKRKELRELKVNLHGRSGDLEVYKPVGEERPALRGRGPAAFQDLVRRTLVKFVDPERRIALPPVQPGVGW